MKAHIYSNKTNRLVNIIENVVYFEEKSGYFLLHVKGEKWFDQIMIGKTEYTTYIEG